MLLESGGGYRARVTRGIRARNISARVHTKWPPSLVASKLHGRYMVVGLVCQIAEPDAQRREERAA
ncbi:MAG TPA: hypothetical protein VGQ10_18815 [Vicinamibacterales bacterium]|nr:hypothetical protein [Vicinamibacterales bacterium]